jgi:hypothetical protein
MRPVPVGVLFVITMYAVMGFPPTNKYRANYAAFPAAEMPPSVVERRRWRGGRDVRSDARPFLIGSQARLEIDQ